MRRLDEKDRFIDWFLSAAQAESAWRARVLECWGYYTGEGQWTSEERAVLNDRGQPAITVNHIKPTIDYAVGIAAKDQHKLVCIPRNSDSTKLSFVGSQALSYVQDLNDFQSARIRVQYDKLIGGLGWFEAGRNNDITKDAINLRWVDWRQLWRDPFGVQNDLSDAKFLIRSKWIDLADAQALFPKLKKKLKLLVEQGQYWGQAELSQDDGSQFWYYDTERQRIRFMEIWFREYAKRPVVADKGQVFLYKPEVHRPLVEAGIPVFEAHISVMRQALVAGDWLIFERDSPYWHNEFPYVPDFAGRDLQGMPQGAVDNLTDSQDEINKRRSKMMHYLQMRQILAEDGAIEDLDKFLDEMARPDGVMSYRKGFKVEIVDNIDLCRQHFELMLEAAAEIKAISGIHAEARGEATNARTGEAIRARSAGSLNVLAPLTVNSMASYKQLGTIILSLVQQFYTDERIIKIAGSEMEGTTLNQPITDPLTGKTKIHNRLLDLRADVIVDSRMSALSERQATMVMFSEVMKSLPPELSSVLLPFYLELLDLPQKDEMVQTIKQLTGGNTNVQQPRTATAGPARPGSGSKTGASPNPRAGGATSSRPGSPRSGGPARR